MKRIGLFGGTFDPIHLGHLLIAQTATEELGLDQLYFIPAATSPFKRDYAITPGNTRLQMLRLALAGKTNWFVDDQEIRRGGISYTIITVRNYVKQFPNAELFYILGSDQARTLYQWKDVDELIRLTKFAVFLRPGEDPNALPTNIPITVIKSIQISISATTIRNRVKENKPIDFYVLPQVAELIRAKNLYK